MVAPQEAVDGTIAPAFGPVRDAFAEVIARQSGTGAAVAVWHDGGLVVDLWGGSADAGRTRPWQHDSIVQPYSVTKPFAAVCALLLVDRGLVELDAQLSQYWPEFRTRATVRQVLSHQAGVVVIDEPLPASAFSDWDLLCGRLAAQTPAWVPGNAHGESALFYGHLVGELVRRVDGRTLGTFLREEVCQPRGLDFFVGLTPAEQERAVDLTGLGGAFWETVRSDRPDLYARALGNPVGAFDPDVVNGQAWRSAEVPAVNGHGTARAVAEFYAAVAAGAVLSPTVVAEATSVASSGRDLVMGSDNSWGLGFGVDDDGFGMGGVGGNLGWWSTVGRYGFGFVTGSVGDFGRVDAVESALRDCLGLPPL